MVESKLQENSGQKEKKMGLASISSFIRIIMSDSLTASKTVAADRKLYAALCTASSA